ncbi:DUF3558 domain-containing protein [Gordonia sp. SID5947]|uniref:DUF3558 domain-containing protein n=1 Tax=Gordonia sp. SID5947 TaxID=2690315 RepID=UPI001370DCF9|nr:DUF3558 domain-containing protein [Gordonia sp. SID5947]MYR08643.1 DUF3558 domain-containing protein [Gordonia sp. SID5947]
MKRVLMLIAALLLVLGLGTACARDIDGEPVAVGAADNEQEGHVDTDQYDKLLLECEVLSTAQIAQAVGGSVARGTFNGAICRWLVEGATSASVTFNWFEWGDPNVEKETAKKLGYETENIKVASQAAFTQRDPKRPAVCGVTARAPSRGVFTWWVEPRTAAVAADPCAAPIKLMELLLSGGQ